MKTTTPYRSNFGARRRQRGVVLIIALIVLVSMTLAAIGMSRSIDTANVIAGNIAFKQATLSGGDIGFKSAYTWLGGASSGTTLQLTDKTQGYYSSLPTTDPNWYDLNDAIWGSAVLLNGGIPDNAGNVVRYVIHRMCTQPDTAYNGANAGVANQCAITLTAAGAGEGLDQTVGAQQQTQSPQLYYRVTTRVDGPRNTVTIVQMSVLLQV